MSVRIWHRGLTKAQSDKLEAVQRRALRIVFPTTVGMSYTFVLDYAGISSLRQRRVEQGKTFFDQICQAENCLNHILPPPRDPELLARLRHPLKYPVPFVRTKRYCSFVQYALANYQCSPSVCLALPFDGAMN